MAEIASYGPKLTWADFVMGRNDPEPPIYDYSLPYNQFGANLIFNKIIR